MPALPAPGDESSSGSSSSSTGRALREASAAGEKGAGSSSAAKVRFTWRLENLVAFRSILETRKVFSRCARALLLRRLLLTWVLPASADLCGLYVILRRRAYALDALGSVLVGLK